MRILLTNDDGIHAEGLSVLEDIARQFSDDIWVVAPEVEQSGKSRALTLTDPVRVRQVSEKRFAVRGTPTDCVLLGLMELVDGDAPDLILSGVNRGQNIAEDTTYSGTIAAAMCGMQHGVRSIALSQSRGFQFPGSLPWDTSRIWGKKALGPVLDMNWPDNVVININFPDRAPEDVTGVEVTRQGFRDENIVHAEQRMDLRGDSYFWIGYRGKLSQPAEGTDLKAIYAGRVSISPLHVDLTHEDTLVSLRTGLANAWET
ncbi:5'/3'-nucleotidase SurE [Ponticaulis sp.]|uniref:5'/3'-nucleotidase SurE n=1 Tax=Ponticaulis sp. TaxID=2020902 RepID=UPI000B63FD76|nr:5'/3'-nucleotidase SurE [Ponticaulis sp.]MAI92098.1 5'/3'-nucleotidase SurE [Ponticaulis sp.]OUX96272.1 MAG: 5'/3'-nucleotidase SurE [Hyphomonadaceae bacterium TMED5]|tara:strand:+ start:66571 stop:67347 length:777 start_codon:yes stop_codon:yes gene_type:complete